MLLNERIDQLIFTGRGSTAIHLALKVGVPENSAIIIPANVCEVVVAVIKHSGYKVVYADVDDQSGNSELDHFKKAYSPEVSAIIAVPNFGSPIDMPALAAWCSSIGVFLIEDLCNALGAKFKDQELGKYGDAAIYSFGYAKIIELGLGGALWLKKDNHRKKAVEIESQFNAYSEITRTAEKSLGRDLQNLRLQPLANPWKHYIPLYESFAKHLIFKLSTQQEHELKKELISFDLASNLKRRAEMSRIYRSVNNPHITHRPEIAGDITWRYSLLAENSEQRGLIVSALRKEGFIVSTWYPCLATYFEPTSTADDYPGASSFGSRVFNLFVDHRVSKETVHQTVRFLNQLEIQ